GHASRARGARRSLCPAVSRAVPGQRRGAGAAGRAGERLGRVERAGCEEPRRASSFRGYDDPRKLRNVTTAHQGHETSAAKSGTGRTYVYGDVLARNEY